jgi:hypothetical protein
MIVLNTEAQKRAKEALQKVDQAITADIETTSTIQEQAQEFRDTLFSALDFIERESINLNEILIKRTRKDANQMEVEIKKYPPFLFILDPELAYESKPVAVNQSQAGEGGTRWIIELAARMFVIFAPPLQGLIRTYTIFGDGSWKRTAFLLASGGVQAQSYLVQRSSPDVLVMETIDLIGTLCTIHPTWSNLASVAETMTTENLRDRSFVKTHLTGLGAPR